MSYLESKIVTMKIHIEDLNLHSDAEDSDSDSKLEDLVLHSAGQDSVLNSEGGEINYNIGLHVINFSHNAVAIVC